MAVEPGDRGAIAQRHGDFAGFARAGEEIADRLEELVDPLARHGRNRVLAGPLGAGGGPGLQGAPRVGGQDVDLVQRLDERRAFALADRAQLAQHGFDIGALLFGLGMGDVAHMHDQVGLDHLFQGRAEGRDQVGRQIGDEAHRVGDHAALAVGQLDRAHGGIERGEQQVLGHHAGARKAIEQRRLAGVGVADQGDRRQPRLFAAGAIDGARAAHTLEIALDPHDALADQAAVDLDL